MNRVYLAAPIFNPAQLAVVQDVKAILEEADIKVFSPYDASQEIWKGRRPADCSPEERARVIQGNIEGLHWCDVLLAWVGGYEAGFTDPGVVWEMGYAAALAGAPAAYDHPQRRPVTLAYIDDHDERQSMNLMLAGTVDAVAKGQAELMVAADWITAGAFGHLCQVLEPRRHLASEREPVV